METHPPIYATRSCAVISQTNPNTHTHIYTQGLTWDPQIIPKRSQNLSCKKQLCTPANNLVGERAAYSMFFLFSGASEQPSLYNSGWMCLHRRINCIHIRLELIAFVIMSALSRAHTRLSVCVSGIVLVVLVVRPFTRQNWTGLYRNACA